MRKNPFLYSLVLLLAAGVVPSSLYAQKIPKKFNARARNVARTKKVKAPSVSASVPHVSPTTRFTAADLALLETQPWQSAALQGSEILAPNQTSLLGAWEDTPLPLVSAQAQRVIRQAQEDEAKNMRTLIARQPDKLVASFIPKKPNPKAQDVLEGLSQLWTLQERYGNHGLFAIFIRQYYAQHFGAVSPHLQMLFSKIAAQQDRGLEIRAVTRLHYLVQNKEALAQAALPAISDTLPDKAFRVRYLSDIGKLTANNFRENQMVLSIERRMSPAPEKDFPIRHVTGQAVVTIKHNVYPVYEFAAPLDQITSLYRFLLCGNKKGQAIHVVFDEQSHAMALFNEDHSLWLRISSHEYSNPQRLHLHLNELRPVRFTNSFGVESSERVNFNLSVPLAPPDNLPKHNVQDFLYRKLVANPVKYFKGDDHVTIERRSIF